MLDYLYHYYTAVRPNPRVLELCGVHGRGQPYTAATDDSLTVIINAFARPEFLPLIWEAVQYQSRRPAQTWIVQNNPHGRSALPTAFFEAAGRVPGTVIVNSGLNLGCWFRFLLAAYACRTPYVAIYDDDTLSGRLALQTALDDLARAPGIYGGRGITFCREAGGPHFGSYEASGWCAGTETATQVDFAGHLWVMETRWLKELFRHLPERIFSVPEPARECGEDMYVSFVAQKLGIPTYVYGHGAGCNARWSSIQAYEMGIHPNGMSSSGGLLQGDYYLRYFLEHGWQPLRYAEDGGGA